MLKVTILAVGGLKEAYLKDAAAEYLKRLGSFCKPTVIEVAEEKAPDKISEETGRRIVEKEGARLLQKLGGKDFAVALSIGGRQMPSEAFAGLLSDTMANFSSITFIIGGSFGLSAALLSRSQLQLSFSRMTFPHQLMRVILLEQIYRGFKILNHEPYHK